MSISFTYKFITRTALVATLFAAVLLPSTVMADSHSSSSDSSVACNADGTLPYLGKPDLIDYRANGDLEFSDFSQSGNNAEITITNNSGCELPVTMGSYEMRAADIESQVLHAEHSTTTSSGEDVTLSVALPENGQCTAEIDVFYGDEAPESFDNQNFFDQYLMANTFYGDQNDEFEENDALSNESNDYNDVEPVNRFCGAPTTGVVLVKKQVENQADTNFAPSDFEITLTQKDGDAEYVFDGSESGQEIPDVPTGTYEISESANTSYVATYSNQCSDGEIDVAAGESVSCTITNRIDTETNDKCEAPNGILPYEGKPDLIDYINDGTLAFSGFSRPNGQAAITVTNNSNCELPLALGVYEMYGNDLTDQKLFSEDQTTVQPNSEATLSSDLPACMAEIDLFYDRPGDGVDGAPESFDNQNFFDQYLMANTFYQNENDEFSENDALSDESDDYRDAGPAANFCSIDDDDGDDLTGSCDVTPSEVEPGEDVEWSANADGGNSPYAYDWDLEGSNDDDDTRTITTQYDEEGTYDGTVTITDKDGNRVTDTCRVRVEEDDDDGGGGGDILDPRDDDDDDDGDVAGDRDPDFSLQCEPAQSSYLIGQTVRFETDLDGDNIDEDDIDYNWENVGNLDADDDAATVQFTSAGEKTVQVEAEYDGETERATCEVDIRRADRPSTPGVGLDDVPYTGPADDLKTAGFVTGFITFALAGGYLFIRRREEDGINVGIPFDHLG